MRGPNLAQFVARLSVGRSLIRELEAVSELGPRELEATILIARLTGYEAVADSEDLARLREVLQAYLRGLEPIVEAHHGSLDSLLGGRAMISFGVFGHADVAAADATRAALQMLSSERGSLRMRLQGYSSRLDLAVGVATGKTLSASIEGQWRSIAGCFGGPVERAQALCELAGPGQLVVDETTRASAGPLSITLETIGANARGQALYRGTGEVR